MVRVGLCGAPSAVTARPLALALAARTTFWTLELVCGCKREREREREECECTCVCVCEIVWLASTNIDKSATGSTHRTRILWKYTNGCRFPREERFGINFANNTLLWAWRILIHNCSKEFALKFQNPATWMYGNNSWLSLWVSVDWRRPHRL